MKQIMFILSLIWLTGCASTGSPVPQDSQSQKTRQLLEDAPHPQTPATRQKVIRSLIAQHEEWANTAYRYGGLSKEGVDCSGFVYLTYNARFQRQIPRTTEMLSSAGTAVEPHQLAPGDLVFFRISPTVRHVGIYIDNDRFLHASKSRGVTISSLTNDYWRQHYWQSRRLALE